MILQAGYPKVTIAEDGAQVTERYFIEGADPLTVIPDLYTVGTPYPSTIPGENATVELLKIDIEPHSQTNLMGVYVSYTWGEPPTGGGSYGGDEDEGTTSYFPTSRMIELPLDCKKKDGSFYLTGYLANWNWALAGWETNSEPAWWGTATDTLDAKPSEGYQWVKNLSEIKPVSGDTKAWKVIKEATKKQEVFLFPVFTVSGRTWFRAKKDAEARLQNIGQVVSYSARFIAPNVGEWRVMSSSLGVDGRKYYVEEVVENAPDWDEDLIPAFS